ncbi:uncharacterized protein LOC142239829 [Haematobia irritans]|uniref:uncharacterized protein LOC142236022 n=1 Tax=Haematobia irritans TaxID=7368 RepID=UPI003F4F8E35
MKAKYLGFILNSRLSCSDHVSSVIGKIYLTLRNLRVTSAFTPVEIKRRLVVQLIVPVISYAAELYSGLDSHSMHKLRVAFNNATRYVYGLSRFDSMTSWGSKVLGIDIIDYLKLRNMTFLHRLIVNKLPCYLFDKLIFGQSNRCLTLIIPRFKYVNSSRMFFINAVRLWNNLPYNVRCLINIDKFKKTVKSFLTSAA